MKTLIKSIRGQISAIRPSHNTKFINPSLRKKFQILEWFKNRAKKTIRQRNHPMDPIVKGNFQTIPIQNFNLRNLFHMPSITLRE